MKRLAAAYWRDVRKVFDDPWGRWMAVCLVVFLWASWNLMHDVQRVIKAYQAEQDEEATEAPK